MTEPLSTDQLKAHLRIVDDDSQNDLIDAQGVAARMWVENYTGHILVQREVTETRDCFGRYLDLQHRPVQASPAPVVTYTDTAGTTQTYAGAVYSLDRSPARAYPALNGWWPPVGRYGGVTITYTAGYDLGQEPAPLLQAILLLVGHWWSNREAVNISTATPSEVPFAVTSICDQYRTPSL